MIRAIVVPGTWGREQDWFRPFSPWAQYLMTQGVCVYEPSGRPFLWSTDIGGTEFWRRWGIGARYNDHWDWMAGGDQLYERIVPAIIPEARIPPAETVVISHSHGAQVVAYALAAGLKIDRWINISGPVRADMRSAYMAGRANVRKHYHIHSDGSDRFQWLGEFGDGVFGIVRKNPYATDWRALPKAGHSGILHDPAWFSVWRELADWLRTA